jgi:serine protease Do
MFGSMKQLSRVRALSLALAALCSGWLSSPLRADPIADADAAYDRKEYATALRIVRPLAESGNADAQFLYGKMYRFGNGTPQNHQEAANWFLKAAEAGNTEAQCSLAALYISAAPFTAKRSEGALLARRGAEKGLPECQIELGYAYALARGRPRDWLIGHVWMNIAAANPNAGRQTVTLAQELRRISERALATQQLADAQLLADEWHRGTPSSTGGVKSGHARNLEAQRLLELLGYDAGTADGVIGATTRAAIVGFRKKIDKPQGGDQVDDELVSALHREWAALGEASKNRTTSRRREIGGTGTGFFVSKQGHVLTNNHVVSSCTSIQLRWPDGREMSAKLVGRSIEDDLAVLRADIEPTEVGTFRPNGQARLGETIVVYGFPLPDLLSSSGNLTTGAVTALAGLRDESRIMQISAPVQAGNSGGPVLDQKGQVVGIIVSKIDVLAVAKKTSDVPQNVNFAIKGSVGTNFLDSKDVEYGFASAAEALPMDDIVRRVKRFTVQVACAR